MPWTPILKDMVIIDFEAYCVRLNKMIALILIELTMYALGKYHLGAT